MAKRAFVTARARVKSREMLSFYFEERRCHGWQEKYRLRLLLFELTALRGQWSWLYPCDEPELCVT